MPHPFRTRADERTHVGFKGHIECRSRGRAGNMTWIIESKNHPDAYPPIALIEREAAYAIPPEAIL